MINNIQETFSIQDLELLTGIKAHTIRIWEKRYQLLNPKRLNRNIRIYNINELQKLLNISLLLKEKYKISELSTWTESELQAKAKSLTLKNNANNYYINSLILAMYNLDEDLFEEIYLDLMSKQTFKDVFINTYLPLLNILGKLWHSNGITLLQEHFISNLIYKKIALNIDYLPTQKDNTSNKVNILFLPKGEIHEISLFFWSYYLKSIGEKVIYLGRDTPPDQLIKINSLFKEINWVTNFIIARTQEEKQDFINTISDLLNKTNNSCTIVGKTWEDFTTTKMDKKINIYNSFHQLIN
jgi:DNA-binding transcriptional MerR regulator